MDHKLKRIAARVLCDALFYLGVFADRVLVRPIPNAIWHLQRPGVALYQWAMGRAFLLDKRHGFGLWQPDSASAEQK